MTLEIRNLVRFKKRHSFGNSALKSLASVFKAKYRQFLNYALSKKIRLHKNNSKMRTNKSENSFIYWNLRYVDWKYPHNNLAQNRYCFEFSPSFFSYDLIQFQTAYIMWALACPYEITRTNVSDDDRIHQRKQTT